MPSTPLLIQQLDRKMENFASLKQVASPPSGWIKGIRTALGMSMQQLGNKLSITKQSIQEIEVREQEGSITLKSLKVVAKALDMQLVYGFVPKDGTLDALIERKAMELAKQIVLRTSISMVMEDQGISEERIEMAIKEKAATFKRELPKILWD